nr:hypothetical protein [uncultured Bacteroides sp.]
MENDKEKLESTFGPKMRWKIDQDKCTTCCECIDACKRSLLYLDRGVITIKYEFNCNQCGDCAAVCGAHAIALT